LKGKCGPNSASSARGFGQTETAMDVLDYTSKIGARKRTKKKTAHSVGDLGKWNAHGGWENGGAKKSRVILPSKSTEKGEQGKHGGRSVRLHGKRGARGCTKKGLWWAKGQTESL